jgi:hypothetical protein
MENRTEKQNRYRERPVKLRVAVKMMKTNKDFRRGLAYGAIKSAILWTIAIPLCYFIVIPLLEWIWHLL